MSDTYHWDIGHGHSACNLKFGVNSCWLRAQKHRVNCKNCLKVKKSTIKKRIHQLLVKEIMSE